METFNSITHSFFKMGLVIWSGGLQRWNKSLATQKTMNGYSTNEHETQLQKEA